MRVFTNLRTVPFASLGPKYTKTIGRAQYDVPAVGHRKTNASAREGRAARSKFKHDLEAIFLVRPFGNLVERFWSPFRDAPRSPLPPQPQVRLLFFCL